MRSFCLLTSAALFAGVAFQAGPASAQTLSVANLYEWSIDHGDRPTNEINRADCLADATVSFSTDAVGNGAFEVWAGSACTDAINRTQNAKCFPVALPDISAKTVTVRVQDLLQPIGNPSTAPDTGTVEVCNVASNTYGGIERNLYFMLRDTGNDVVLGQAVTKPFLFDITRPPPPTAPSAGPGEESLTVSFTAPVAGDLNKYRFYCSEVGPAPEPEGAGGAGADAAPAPEPNADPTCTSSELIPGRDPPPANACGEVGSTGTNRGIATGLGNGVRYAVAIASEDKYRNVGTLSALACGTPQEVTGFFEAYRAAGGQAGGGFCSFGPAPRGALPTALALLLGGFALARRRR